MTLTNQQLLTSGPALRQLMGSDIRGVFSLRLSRLAPKFDEELQRLQDKREELEKEKDDEAAAEEWQEILEDTLELPGDRLPEKAVYEANVSAYALQSLDWLIDFNDPADRSK